MFKRSWVLGAAVAAVVILAGCNGSSGGGGGSVSSPMYLYDYSVTGVATTTPTSFDISWMDNTKGRYYLADRTAKGLDVYDSRSRLFVGTVTGGFTGLTSNGDKSGPNGATLITGTNLVYVPDVGNVMVVDGVAMKVVTTVSTNNAALGGTGWRTDEGCYDPVHHRYMVTTPAVPNDTVGHTPFVTVLDTTNPSAPVVTGYISFFDPTDLTGARNTPTGGTAAVGLEQCAYDPVNDQFLINNDATVANPDGEVNAMGGAAVAAIAGGAVVNYTALAGYKVFGIGGTAVNCQPRGLDLGPGTTPANAEFAIDCSNGTGKPMVSLIMNRSTGAIVHTAAVGGGDQITYDASTNAYYVTASNWNPTGIRAPATTKITPVLGVVDATTGAVIARLPAGQSAHSVTVDAVTHLAFVPHTTGTALGNGGTTCDPSWCVGPFAGSGVSVYLVQ